MKKIINKSGLLILIVLMSCKLTPEADWTSQEGFIWKSPVPEDSPFEKSKELSGVYFAGRPSGYKAGDTFYPGRARAGDNQSKGFFV